MFDAISWREFRESEGLEDWRNLSDGASAMFKTDSFAVAAAFVAAISTLPLAEIHPPAIDIRPQGVTIHLLTVTDDYDGMTARDVELARAVSQVAHQHGLTSDPTAVQSVLVIPGAPPGTEVAPFWRAVFGYDRRPGSAEDDLVDPSRRGLGVWVEPMHQARSDGGAIHVAIWVAHEVAQARVEAALEAGGRLVRDRGPAWWTLADPAGNEADIATTMGRD
jgi:4a-hydroxytetrahydrobiopterin dehydratase